MSCAQFTIMLILLGWIWIGEKNGRETEMYPPKTRYFNVFEDIECFFLYTVCHLIAPFFIPSCH